jgi:glycosyltransferase involved in cell wall biosynthesis
MTSPAPRQLSVSVVVPALNEAASIATCLRSLAAQDYAGPVEVIVVDNGSIDGTADIARRCGAQVVDEPTRGVCRARQSGTEHASGDIVVSTDADTTFSTDWLTRIAAEFDRGGASVAGVCGPCRFVDGPRWARAYTACLFGVVWLLYRVTGRVCYGSATNIAFRRDAWLGYDVTLTQGGDELALLRSLRRAGPLRFVRANTTWTSSRRLHRGFVYSALVTCLWYYVAAYALNRVAGRTVVGHAPSIRIDNHDLPGVRLRAYLAAAMAALVLAGIYLITPLDIDLP